MSVRTGSTRTHEVLTLVLFGLSLLVWIHNSSAFLHLLK